MIRCIIPARGGSKGIPKKNILPIAGKPLIAWSIEQAKASLLIGEVWVSTDDDEIAEVARACGAEVWRRDPETATDTASSESCLIDWMQGFDRDRSEAIVFLQATSPVRQPDDIDNAIRLLRETQADSVFSARIVEGYTWSQVDGMRVRATYQRTPRQLSRSRTLEENGSIYVFRPRVMEMHGMRIGGHVEPYIMHPLDSFQLDEPCDIPLIEQMLELRCGSHHAITN